MKVRGRIDYLRRGAQTGREWFQITPVSDGFQIEARCEMDDDRLTRQCVWRLDAAGRPREAFVRVEQEGASASAALWRIDGVRVEQAILEPGAPLQTMVYESPDPVAFIALHPLIGDGFAALLHDPAGPARQTPKGCVSSSHRANGGGPQRADGYSYAITRLDDEAVETAAGRFACQHYALSWREEWPDADLWVAPGPLPLMVRLAWPLLDATYDLVALETDPA